MSDAWAQNQIYWATLAYARWWMAIDAPFIGALKAQNGFTVPLLRRVAVRYNVNRGILQADDGSDSGANGIVGLIHDASRAGNWPSSLLERAATCLRIAQEAQSHGHTATLQVSGISKFMWFLNPQGWTLFDRFASAGMNVPSYWSRKDQFVAFYERLDEAGFQDVVGRIEPIVVASCLPNLPTSRIVDSLLMARGQRGSAHHEVGESRAFLDILPRTFRDGLHDLAATLQGEVGNAALAAPVRLKKRSNGA